MRKKQNLLVLVLSLFLSSNLLATKRYIDPASGDDSHTGLTAGTAWQSWIYSINQMSGGDTLIVVNGTYNNAIPYMDQPGFPVFPQNNRLVIKAQTNLGAIFTGGAGNGETLPIDGLVGYVWDGFEFRSATSNVVHIQNASYITLKNCKIHDALNGGDGDVVKINQCNHIGVESCEVYDPSVRAASPGFYQECFDIVDADDSYLKNCWLHHVGSRGTILGYCKGGTHNNVFEGNVFGPQSSVGDQPAVLFGGSTDSWLFQAGEHFESENMVMKNNIFYTCRWGAVGFYDALNSYLVNNLFVNCGGRIKQQPLTIQENEISQAIMEIRAGNADSLKTRNVFVYNNIFYDTDGDMPALFHNQGCNGASDLVTKNNLYWNSGKAIPVCGFYDPSTEVNAKWQEDPLMTFNEATFTSYQNIVNGFTISNASAIWNSGVNTTATPFPGVTTDLNANPRNFGSTTDIGPWELQTASTPSVATVLCTPTLTLNPTQDTYIDFTAQTDNYGMDTYLRLYGGYEGYHTGYGSERRTPLLKFNISAIPATATITAATLILTPDVSQGAESSNGCTINETNAVVWIETITRTWTEGTGTQSSPTTNGATYQKYNGVNNWNTLSGDGDTTQFLLRYCTIYPDTDPRFAQPEKFDVTWMVQQWATGAIINNGMMLRAFNGGKYYYSNQAGTANKPKLEICYITSAGFKQVSENQSITFYPNPTNGKIFFTSGLQEPLYYRVINAMGQEMQSGILNAASAIDLSTYAEGLYIIQTTNASATFSKSTIVNKSN